MSLRYARRAPAPASRHSTAFLVPMGLRNGHLGVVDMNPGNWGVLSCPKRLRHSSRPAMTGLDLRLWGDTHSNTTKQRGRSPRTIAVFPATSCHVPRETCPRVPLEVPKTTHASRDAEP